ncbi:uncharacterized protein LOC113335777 isoform X2 [Papaver somniferum]|uniref:uncharacterized protein LOC113335777 isoform X2 n=1 Tax=Papaver somniferum TaxID=3469 RepID=UPI000E7021F4|nr:uncharacterized protein LOC113335777 isoform X2 [Papaver somniferum]
MASGGENFYSVLGVKKECTVSELRNAYKKLAMRWHPDRCSASGNSKFIEESKKKFQSIQEAYSVLSNANKRFMYDLGLYKNDDDDDDDNEMGDFLGEMVDLMAQTKPIENSKAETFEDLQVLFEAMVQDLNSYSGWEQMDFRPAESHGQSFCLGAEGGLEDSRGGRGSSKRRTAGKQKSSSQHNMSARDSKISV